MAACPHAMIAGLRKDVAVSDTIKVTLSAELARMVKEKVASGTFASESEVVGAGLRALQEQEAATEEWLRTEGVARYEAYRREPLGQPVGEAFARLRKHHEAQSRRR